MPLERRDMKALVTGGTGYFGSLLVRHLLNAGDTVRVLDSDPSASQLTDVEVIIADVRDVAAVTAAAADADVVYHCVAEVPLGRNPLALRSVNVDGTVAVLDASRSAGVTKIVHLSSSAVFGIPESNPVQRDTVPKPQEPYGAAKLAAEWACLHASSAGLDVTIVRPRTILGHGRLGLFAVLFDWIADGADPLILGDGSNRYQFVHADDLATLCRLAALRAGPTIYNAGTDRFGTMGEAIEHVCLHANTGARVRSVPQLPAAAAMRLTARLGLTPFAPYHWLMYSQSMWFDIDHAVTELGWHPRYSNDEMLADSYDWFVDNRALAESGSAASPHRRALSSPLLSVLKRAATRR
jgi:nucleoside-diphosphate-sugar epimerase